MNELIIEFLAIPALPLSIISFLLGMVVMAIISLVLAKILLRAK